MAAHRISMLYCDISKERDPLESKMQNSKWNMQNAKYEIQYIQNAKCKKQHTEEAVTSLGSKMRNAKFKIQNAKCKM